MRDDPHDISEYLVQEHGIDLALERATDEIIKAHDNGDKVDTHKLSIPLVSYCHQAPRTLPDQC